ncbi:MAG: (deoxy)nucleoside triphosphate pyrophosphohydrolase [Myxococcaceae bacterium]|nr:(deoxy)nucleoside triphosphate pyrophosphohydrolase [Myxococcaceae bacterium]
MRVVAGLIADPTDATRFLVQQRLPNASRANLWEFPGGKIEPGETEAEALVREGREELDVELSVGRRLWGTVHEYPDLIVELELLVAHIVTGSPKALGAQAIRFATPHEMKALPFCEADVPLLDALATGAVPTR